MGVQQAVERKIPCFARTWQFEFVFLICPLLSRFTLSLLWITYLIDGNIFLCNWCQASCRGLVGDPGLQETDWGCSSSESNLHRDNISASILYLAMHCMDALVAERGQIEHQEVSLLSILSGIWEDTVIFHVSENIW